jgi:hypothetical protein
MKKQIDVWEGVVAYIDTGLGYSVWCIDGEEFEYVESHIEALEGKKVRVTIEVIE